MSHEPQITGKIVLIGEVKEQDLERRVYTKMPGLDPITISLGCPIGQEVCGQLENILSSNDKLNVFVAIPYSDYEYEELICDVLVNAGLNPILAKDRIESKILLCKVCRELRKCSYGVADISQSNLNVIYELGLMQTLGRPCAILFESGSERPIDLQGIENVYYSNEEELCLRLAQWLKDNVASIEMGRLNGFLRAQVLKLKHQMT